MPVTRTGTGRRRVGERGEVKGVGVRVRGGIDARVSLRHQVDVLAVAGVERRGVCRRCDDASFPVIRGVPLDHRQRGDPTAIALGRARVRVPAANAHRVVRVGCIHHEDSTPGRRRLDRGQLSEIDLAEEARKPAPLVAGPVIFMLEVRDTPALRVSGRELGRLRVAPSATQNARDELSTLRVLFKELPRDTMVKFAFQADSGGTEHLWGDLLALDEETFEVRVKTPPATHDGKFQKVQRRAVSEIKDWQVEQHDGRIRGGFGYQVLFHRTKKRLGYLPKGLAEHEDRFVDHDLGALMQDSASEASSPPAREG